MKHNWEGCRTDRAWLELIVVSRFRVSSEVGKTGVYELIDVKYIQKPSVKNQVESREWNDDENDLYRPGQLLFVGLKVSYNLHGVWFLKDKKKFSKTI